jgi:hypothetical protein
VTTSATNRRTRIATRPHRGVWFGLIAGVLLSALIVVPSEVERFRDSGTNPLVWLFNINIDTSPFLLLLVLMPLMWRRNGPSRQPRRRFKRLNDWLCDSPRSDRPGAILRVSVGVAIVSGVAMLACLRVAWTNVSSDGSVRFGELPPALHDEFSYLLQARTFQDGHWTYPSHPVVPRLFDQMHVLNEGRFASRYFPGTAAWIATFSTFGSLYAGHWIATALVCSFLFLSGRELSCNGVGLLAGLLAALSPGIDLFGNLLLSHQPTLAGLGLFLFGFLRMTRSRGNSSQRVIDLKWVALSGIGLSFAMLCRPMTAAGFAAPFGIVLAVRLIRTGRERPREAASIVMGFGIPLAMGLGVLAIQNLETTGSPFQSPYQLYTELFTPRHMYGFNNVERARPLQNPRVLKHYDEWAENLDAGLAVQNVKLRLISSSQWTLGIVALLITTSVFCGLAITRIQDRRQSSQSEASYEQFDARWWLIGASIISLHAVHIPYWYDGILHWHYVFESSVLWCLLAAIVTLLIVRLAREEQRVWLPLWWSGLIVASVLVNQTAFAPFWGLSRLDAGINEFAFARGKQLRFRQLTEAVATDRPTLILVRHDPSDRHIDYVDNHPGLTSDVLVGRLPADSQTSEEETLRAAIAAFRDRAIIIYDAKTGQSQRVNTVPAE